MKSIFICCSSGQPPGVVVNSQFEIAHRGTLTVAVLTSIVRQESCYVC